MNLTVLFVVAAVAFLLWARPHPPAELGPSLPPLGSVPATRPPGLSPVVVALLVVPWSLLAFSFFAKVENSPAPPVVPASGLDLRGTFTGSGAAADAALTAALMRSLADTIEYDGKNGRRLSTATQLAELRSVAREYATGGVSLGQRQPLARDAIKAFLDREVGTDGGPIDDAARARWVASFRDIARAASAAIGR